jgi:hypothetical protein
MAHGKVHEISRAAVFIASNGDCQDLDKYTGKRAFECAECGTVPEGRFAGDASQGDRPYR